MAPPEPLSSSKRNALIKGWKYARSSRPSGLPPWFCHEFRTSDQHDRPNSVLSLGRGMVSGNTANPVIRHSSLVGRDIAVQQPMGTDTNFVRLDRRESISKILLILPQNIEKGGCNSGWRVAIV